MDPVEELMALEAIKKVKHQYAHNLDGKGRFQRVGDSRGLTAWWAWTETVPSHGEVRTNGPAIFATAGINNRRLEP